MKIVLVCGGRDFNDYAMVSKYLGETDADLIIQGGARGADALAKRWAGENAIHCAEVPAMWALLGKRAGPTRNYAMLALQPSLVLAFPGGAGTDHMKRIARKVGVRVWDVAEPRFVPTEAGIQALRESKAGGE